MDRTISLNPIELQFNVEADLIIDDIYCKYFFFDKSKPLIITFANAGALYDTTSSHENQVSPWGYDFIKGKKLNILSFACTVKNSWYRSRVFYQFCKNISPQLNVFSERLGYGGSMGGYAVSAFSEIFSMDRILIYNPISTLNKSLVPWETRFKDAYKLDWETGVYDAAETNVKGFIVYDPIYSLDTKHANRYKNLIHLKVPGVGHGMPQHIKQMGLLKLIFENFVNKSLNKNEFQILVKVRRKLPRYYSWLLSAQNTHLTEKRKDIIEYFKNKQFSKSVSIELTQDDFIMLRDLALSLESVDLKKAYRLMCIAHCIMPSGKLVKRKLEEYKKNIGINEYEKHHVG